MAKAPPAGERSGIPTTIRLDEEIASALKDYIESASPTPTKTAVIEAALKEFLRSHGFANQSPSPAPLIAREGD